MGAATVTVFGGTGFLGRRIVATLLEAGREVRVATRHPETGDAAAWASRVESIAADVRDPEAVARAVQGADAIVNAVSLYVEGQGLDFESVHVDGARNIAQAAEGRPLVHVSGIGAHESSPSAYVRARARGERAVRDACSNAIILRPSVLFGPNDAFLRTLDAISRLPLIPLFGRGDTKLQPVHVDDLAMAVLHAMDDPAAAGKSSSWVVQAPIGIASFSRWCWPRAGASDGWYRCLSCSGICLQQSPPACLPAQPAADPRPGAADA